MRQENLIIVLTGEELDHLARSVINLGYQVLIVENMQQALNKMHYFEFSAAIIVAGKKIDPLEFVLNARDIDDGLPIIVVDYIEDSRVKEKLLRLPDVSVLESNSDELEKELSQSLRDLGQ